MAPRKKKPSPEALEAQGTAILEADRDYLVQATAKLLEHAQTLRAAHEALLLPSNDPHYLQALQARDKTREEIAAKISMLHLMPDSQSNKTWISAAFSHADGEQVARLMMEHFEAKLQRHEEQ